MLSMPDPEDQDALAEIVAVASAYGAASRNELLAAAVSARAAATVIDMLLHLPEGSYRSVEQVRAALLVRAVVRAATTSPGRSG